MNELLNFLANINLHGTNPKYSNIDGIVSQIKDLSKEQILFFMGSEKDGCEHLDISIENNIKITIDSVKYIPEN